MIIAENPNARRTALAKILPMQRDDFKGIFKIMDGLPVTIRLLDPPLHEFLPHGDDEIKQFARSAGRDEAHVRRLVEKHHEANPMLGHRGCRLGISHSEITEMQSRAIFEAAAEMLKEGFDVRPEVMVPLVGTVAELVHQKKIIRRVATEVMGEFGVSVPYTVGTMIEVPRAALMADEIAKVAEFFSFGTNDLTQTTYGISRDDAGSFLPRYIEEGIYQDDPFAVIDREGVGQLVQMATWDGKQRRPTLKVGICGEHGGDPKSVEFFDEVGLDYVSCSPFRVPVARLAAAHAALKNRPPQAARKQPESKPLAAPIPMPLPQVRIET
jgi:pyruvate,orthophosphate dikinase